MATSCCSCLCCERPLMKSLSPPAAATAVFFTTAPAKRRMSHYYGGWWWGMIRKSQYYNSVAEGGGCKVTSNLSSRHTFSFQNKSTKTVELEKHTHDDDLSATGVSPPFRNGRDILQTYNHKDTSKYSRNLCRSTLTSSTGEKTVCLQQKQQQKQQQPQQQQKDAQHQQSDKKQPKHGNKLQPQKHVQQQPLGGNDENLPLFTYFTSLSRGHSSCLMQQQDDVVVSCKTPPRRGWSSFLLTALDKEHPASHQQQTYLKGKQSKCLLETIITLHHTLVSPFWRHGSSLPPPPPQQQQQLAELCLWRSLCSSSSSTPLLPKKQLVALCLGRSLCSPPLVAERGGARIRCMVTATAGSSSSTLASAQVSDRTKNVGGDADGSRRNAKTSSASPETNMTSEPFLTGTSAAYVEQMYAAWRHNPSSVHASWSAYFSNVQQGLPPQACFSLPPTFHIHDSREPTSSTTTTGGGDAAFTTREGDVTHTSLNQSGTRSRSSSSMSSSNILSSGGSGSSSYGSERIPTPPPPIGSSMWCPYVATAPGSLPAGSSFVSPDVVGEGPTASPQSVQDTSRLIQMVRGYQLRGHEYAATNPLNLPRTLPFVSVPQSVSASALPKLDYTTYGFSEADLTRVFDYRVPGMEGFLSAERPPQTLGQLVRRLEEAYCGSIGVEYMHINDREVCNFIRKHIETPDKYAFPPEIQQKILARTARAQLFENFCGQRFSTSKRFGLDGCETMIVGLKALTKKAAREGIKSVVIGMPHRGRLNVLVNILHKPMQQLLSEFLGVTKYSLAEWGNSGDVKYHLGVEFDHFDADAQRYIHMGVLPNPSHLEAVDPLVIGQARAQQYYTGDRDCTTVLPILLHGDASIAGQGVVYETLQMSQLPFYRVGGAIHIVVNNQIGFTTNPVDSCSGRYCTDVAKAFDAPIFHVNADDPEAVTFVSELVFKYRQQFKGDVFIDLIGYRRLGHNELDMPKFTQPAMYTLISQHKPVFDLYSEKLKQQGVVKEEDLQQLKENISTFYNAEYEKCKKYLPTQYYEYSPQWKHLVRPDVAAAPRLTGVRVDRLRELGTRLYTLPPNFSVHPTVGKIFKERLHAVQADIDDKVIDFGTAETLCYATLLSDGFHVRVAGQDVQRGTFSHRHAVLHDQTTFEPYCIYHSLRGYNFPHEIVFANSLLSEYAAMGYEFGYSLEHPDSLCVWEAQFGDFSNGAQIIIDQFVASGEVKWNRQSGIVLMLPHGYDGQGPEHSSGRIERLLQLCDDREDVIHRENWEIEKSSVIQQHNLQVIMPSTPANMFHALRRQVHREFRKPLIIFSPKRMLKMRAAMCALRQLDEGTRFRRYIPDKTAVPEKVRRLIVCSGQVYYDIIAAREKRRASQHEATEAPGDQIAVARMEQLSPFPFDLFIKDLQQFPNLQTVVWAQEEPMNQGAWFYTSKRIENSLSHIGFPNGIRAPIYAGRDVNATTAVGDKRLHDQEVAQLLEDALDLGRVTHSYLEKYIHKQKEKEGRGENANRNVDVQAAAAAEL